MQQTPLGLVLSTSDLLNFLECRHRTNSDLLVSQAAFARPKRRDARSEFLAEEGLSHEDRYLQQLRAEGRQVVEITASGQGPGLLAAVAQTEEAMRNGAEVIYQAAFFNAPWIGHADFLIRTPDGGYEVVDTKLAQTPRAGALLQITAYSAHVARLQGREPEKMHLRTGDNKTLTFRVKDFSALHRRLEEQCEEWAANPQTTNPEPVPLCASCDFLDMCETQWIRDDDTLQLGLSRQMRQRLDAHGIDTVKKAADTPADLTVPGVNTTVWRHGRMQAQMQVAKRRANSPRFQFYVPEGERSGLAALPAPTSKDVYVNLEGAPEVAGGGHEYLWGVRYQGANGAAKHQHRWAFTDAEEMKAFTEFVDFVGARHQRHPDMHVYHYGAYETVALKRLARRFGTHIDEVDALIKDGVFVDLLPIMRQSVYTSEGSYSLKAMEALYGFQRSGDVREAGDSLVLFHQARQAALTTDGRVRRPVMFNRLASVKDYNTADLDSLYECHAFAERGRTALIEEGASIARPQIVVRERTPEQQAAAEEIASLYLALTRDLPLAAEDRTVEQQAQWTIAQLLDFHAREARPEWQEHNERLRMSEPQLYEDFGAIAGLTLAADFAPQSVDRSYIYKYRFDPAQDFTIKVGDRVIDPRTEKSAGVVESIDDARGVLLLRRGKSSKAPHPRSVIAPTPISTKELHQSILRFARSVLETGIDGPGAYRAERDFFLRRVPTLKHSPEGSALVGPRSVASKAFVRAAHNLKDSCLVGQGPPGSGKTTTVAAAVIDAVRAGRTVFITASSHRIITGDLDAIAEAAEAKGMTLNMLQRAPRHEGSTHAFVDRADSTEDVLEGLDKIGYDVIAGTAWLFSNPELFERADVLIIDEAGRFSLADFAAVAGSARNLVMIGDQQQLEQPIQGSHPEGTDVSALEYFIDADIIDPTHGVLLGETHRMHPRIVDWVSPIVYDGQLRSAPKCGVQEIHPNDELGGAGNRFIQVKHDNNVSSSPEEAEVVVKLYMKLLGRTWTNRDGDLSVIGPNDVIISTPTNAQASTIRKTLQLVDPELAAKARIGTTDRMQGQEAAVQIYSLAASSPERVTRSFSFQYSLQRLNVAVTRAQVASYVVASPAMLTPVCRTPEELRMANALNAYVETSVVLDENLEVSSVPVTPGHNQPTRQPLSGTPAPSPLLGQAAVAEPLGIALNHR